MKTNFNLFLTSLLCGLASASFGQASLLTQPFSNDIGTASNYPGWTFNTSGSVLYWTGTQNNHTINAGTLVFDQSNANGIVSASVITPNLTLSAGTINISFSYDLHGNLSGGSYRKIILSLMDGSGNLTALDSLLLTAPGSGVQTFSTSKLIPATMQRKLVITLEGKSSGSTFLLFDNLNITNPFAIVPVPVKLASFQGNMNKYKAVTLQWQVADNETAGYFEIQRSVNGVEFSSVGVVMAADVDGTQNYQYTETTSATGKLMYRLKMVDKFQVVAYSRILLFENKVAGNSNAIRIYGNPVKDKLMFSIASTATQTIDVKVFDLSGHLRFNQRTNSFPGDNTISLPLSDSFQPGQYVVAVNDGVERYTAKFVKQ